MESREQRIMTLATTLKSSGIAKTDSQARMMAEDMIGVEEHVQRSYEEEHTRATEYLRTTKNLGDPRQASQSNQQTSQSNQFAKIEPLSVSQRESVKEPIKESNDYVKPLHNKSNTNDEYTDVNFGTKTLNQAHAEAQDHDTHNSMLEAMKEQLKNTRIIPLEDMEQPKQSISAQSLLEEVSKGDVSPDSSDDLESPQKVPLLDEAEDAPVVEPTSVEEESTDDVPVVEPLEEEKLDTQKLVEMMEEDGKLEEHTRQITEKPKDVKPKEAYEENNIDLSNVFSFNKK